MIKKVYIFGANGMLGTYVYQYLKKFKYDIIPLTRKELDISKIHSIEQINDIIDKKDETIIINCAGVIKPQIDKIGELNAIIVNSVFPHLLADYCEGKEIKCIHITTDCVYSGNEGKYDENHHHDALDIYGKTKSLGEPKNATIIRTSIIGEEINNKRSLIEWVKNQKGREVNGFDNHYWNGITCLQFAKICKIIIDSGMYWRGVRHIFSPDNITKTGLLSIINDVYKLELKIKPIKTPIKCDRTLTSIYKEPKFEIPKIRQQLKDLIEFKLDDEIYSSVCVECNKKATEGSMQHPYCKKCFKKIWNNNYKRYIEWLHQKH